MTSEFLVNVYQKKCPKCSLIYFYKETNSVFNEDKGVIWKMGTCPNCKEEFIMLF
jgi:ribosomal protein S27AE